MSSSRRYPISSLSSVIHCLGILVTSSGLHLESFLHILVLEAPAIGSKFLESFVHTSLESPYLLAFAFAYSTL